MQIGDRIPEILGIDQDGNEIKSSDYRGRKIVLYSYPKANTSGCTAEACSLQAHKEELAAAGYEIIGVSKDKQALQKKFAETQGLTFPLIADTETSFIIAYYYLDAEQLKELSMNVKQNDGDLSDLTDHHYTWKNIIKQYEAIF